MTEEPKVPLHIRDEPVVTITQAEYDQLLEALELINDAETKAGGCGECYVCSEHDELMADTIDKARAVIALAKPHPGKP